MTDGRDFARIFEALVPRLRAYARNRGFRGPDADDLVAATLEVAWRRRGDLPSDDPVPWLFAVERNLIRNLRRSDTRRVALLRRLPSSDAGEDDASEPSVDRAAVRAALDRLGPDDQEILRLVAWDELTPAQAARVIGCTDVAARSRLHRARRRLAASLGVDDTLQRASESEQSMQ